jgi:prophage regulatory protein
MDSAGRKDTNQTRAASAAGTEHETKDSTSKSLSEILADSPQLAPPYPLPFRRTIRRPELHQIVPLADTTIYDMERRGEFPRRFNLTSRCVVWDLSEVETWIEERRRASNMNRLKRAPSPDVRQRRRRPIRPKPSS